jgi:16S rRNA (guanine527-N7)-methyltransferase
MTPDWPACRARLDEGLTLMRLELPEQAREQLMAYLRLLHKWNRAYNLTAVRDPLEMVGRHLLDSLAILPFVTAERLADLGSGAGLPGIPLAIARSATEGLPAVTLVDANGKKTRFLQQVALELGLPLEVRQQRLEDGPKGLDDGRWPQVCARACASLAELWRLARPWLAEGGELLAMKGASATLEQEIAELQGTALAVHRLQVPFLNQEQRHLLILRTP